MKPQAMQRTQSTGRRYQNTTSGTSWLARSPALSPSRNLAHLIRGTSIISSSNPHELTVQGEREAAPAGVHRVQAVCWPRGPAAPPRAAASQGRLCVHSCPVGSPYPHLSAPTQAPARRPAGTAPSARRQRPRKGPAERRAAFLPSGHTGARPSLARSRRPPQEEATLHLRRHSSGTTLLLPRAGALPLLPRGGKGPPRVEGRDHPGRGQGRAQGPGRRVEPGTEGG